MSIVLQTLERRPTSSRVVPRRRGESTPTTIAVVALAEAEQTPEPIHVLPIRPIDSDDLKSEISNLNIQPPVPQATRFELAIRESLKNPRIRRQFESLADAISSPVNQGRTTSLAFFAPGSSEQTAEAIARLATVLGERNQGRVLLVDGNSAERHLTRRFQIEAKLSLAEMLGAGSVWREQLSFSTTDRLEILACGPAATHNSPASRPALRGWLDTLNEEYRYVLCDAGSSADPLGMPLGQVCQAAYVVVELGTTESTAARQSIAAFRERGAIVLGCIVVDAASV